MNHYAVNLHLWDSVSVSVCVCVCVCVCVYVCVFYACMHVGLCAGGDAIMFECLSCIV